MILTQGPDLALFAHPGVLSRLALWLVEALRDRLPGTAVANRRGGKSRKSLPFVVACLNEKEETYIVVGVMAALDFGDVRKKSVILHCSLHYLCLCALMLTCTISSLSQ